MMDDNEKNLLELLKNFDLESLYLKGSYVDISIQDIWRQGYIREQKPKDKFDIIFLFTPNQDKFLTDVSTHLLGFYGENQYFPKYWSRGSFLNHDLYVKQSNEVVGLINVKLKKLNLNLSKPFKMNAPNQDKNINKANKLCLPDKTGKLIDISGYYTYQFLAGFLLDCIVMIMTELSCSEIDGSIQQLMVNILDIIIFVGETVKENLKFLKSAFFNRKLIIISQLHAILLSFGFLLHNSVFLCNFNFKDFGGVDEKLETISNLCYQILLASKENTDIPLPMLLELIDYVTYKNNFERIKKYEKVELFRIYLKHVENFSEIELKNIKKTSILRLYSNRVVNSLFNKNMETLVKKCFYSFLLNCLKCKNLEKKMSALNDLSDIIVELSAVSPKIDNEFYKFFFEQNKILEMFFGESVHDEVVRRSSPLFKYLAMYDKLSEEIIEKLIQGQSNDIMKNILCDVVSELPEDKKYSLFQRLTEGMSFEDNKTNIDYVTKLTESCFNVSARFYLNEYEKSDEKVENLTTEETKKNNETNKQKSNNENKENIDNAVNEKGSTDALDGENLDEIDKKLKSHKSRQKQGYYYGITLLFDYIIKDFNPEKIYKDNNVDQAIESLVYVIPRLMNFESEDIEYFLDKLFDNIKNNTTHNSVVQSLLLIKKLINRFRKVEDCTETVKRLDEKYNIISLLVDDFVRYMNIFNENKEKFKEENDIDNENVYEGIYTHETNVDQRLKTIFFFVKGEDINFCLDLEGKEHIEKIYRILKPDIFKKELQKFFGLLTKNIYFIEDKTLLDFFKDIIQNNKEFDLANFDGLGTLNFIIRAFIKVNEDKEIFLSDYKNIRMVCENFDNIEGFDMLFDILSKNSNTIVQNRISDLLCEICLNVKDYKADNPSKYWKKFFEKIQVYLNNTKDIQSTEFDGMINLINRIYSLSCNFGGKIPIKEDVRPTPEPFEIYHFAYVKSKKTYKLRASPKNNLVDLRWKLGYYYDLPVNDVIFIDKNGNKYSIENDFENFYELFPYKEYTLPGDKFIEIKVDNVAGHLLSIKDNPKELIENNKEIFDMFIDSLKYDKKLFTESTKQKTWNIISKLPKNYYFESKISQYGKQEQISKDNLNQIFNFNEKYILTYTLQCIFAFILIPPMNETKKEFLDNFINFHHIDKLLYDIILNSKIESLDSTPIEFECLNIIIDSLTHIEQYKKERNIKKIPIQSQNEKKTGDETETSTETETEAKEKISEEKPIVFENIIEKIGTEKILQKISELIMSILSIKFDALYQNIYIDNTRIENEESETDYDRINKIIFNLLNNIINFLDIATENKEISYMDFLLSNPDLFKKIFIYDFINCEKEELQKILNDFLEKKLFEKSEYITKYFDLILTVELFNYLVKNDKDGEYFHVLSNVMRKYKEDFIKNNKDAKVKIKYEDQFRQIIDLILTYIDNECNRVIEKEDSLALNPNKSLSTNNIITTSESGLINNNNKEKKGTLKIQESFKIEGIITFLINILDSGSKDLVNYIINKVDVIDLFLNKCILRKCTEKPLDEKEPLCFTYKSQGAVFDLIIFILKSQVENGDTVMYDKICERLNNFHQMGFWKNGSLKNWELESREIHRGKYVGLKNMTSTCYLNSIIQQLFMIPMLRETILSIKNENKENVLYQLQLLFTALKASEFHYYDPRSFVIANKLNFYEQMDADEFYGTLIDKIENDIKSLYSNKKEESSKEENKQTNDYPYKDIFRFFFGIKVLDELKFVDCGHKRFNEFFYNSIQLEVKGFNNIYESFKNYFKTEIMDGDNKINCEECNVKRTCHKHLILKSLPNILVISLKRFEFDYNTMLKYKLNNYCEFPFELDMKDYLIEDHTETNTEYELTGITIHFGVSDFGHYYDLIKGPDDKWYKFNDTSVTEFRESDIPNEAFGEKDSDDDIFKDIDEKENGNNNAYILIYKKKGFDIEPIENISKNYKCDHLIFPPYDKFSNINEDHKNELNFQMFKGWTLKNILSPKYQSFVLNLAKMDLVKHLDKKLEKCHGTFFATLREESFIHDDNDVDENKEKQQENESEKAIDYKKAIDKNSPFVFTLRYYFNVMLRVARKVNEKNNIREFTDVIKLYIESDVEKAKYILEEFSDNDTINEFLVICPSMESVKNCLEIILESFKVILINKSTNKNILTEFINTYLIFIVYNFNTISLEYVFYLFNQLIHMDKKFIIYLKNKKLDKYVVSMFSQYDDIEDDEEEDEETNLSKLVNEDTFPKLKTNHFILSEKIMNFNLGEKGKVAIVNDDYSGFDHQYMNKLKDIRNNYSSLKELYIDLIN